MVAKVDINSLPKFSDFNKHMVFDGRKQRLSEIEGRLIVVLAFRVLASKFSTDKPCVEIQFQYADGEGTFITFTSSRVLGEQLKSMEEQGKLPFVGTLAKCDRFYSFQ